MIPSSVGRKQEEMTKNQRIATKAEIGIAAVERVVEHIQVVKINEPININPANRTNPTLASTSASTVTDNNDTTSSTSGDSTTKLVNVNELSPSTSKSPPNPTIRKIPQLGALSKQQYLLVLKEKLAAISRHLRRFDAAIALVRSQEAKRKAEAKAKSRSGTISVSYRKLYNQVKQSQHRHDVLVERRKNRKRKLNGREPKYLTPSVPIQLLRKNKKTDQQKDSSSSTSSTDNDSVTQSGITIVTKTTQIPKSRKKTISNSPKLLTKKSMLTTNLPSNTITTSPEDAETVMHVPTIVYSTIIMELRVGPRSPGMMLKSLVSNLPGGPRMAAKLLRKIEITFAILSGLGLIKVKEQQQQPPPLSAPSSSSSSSTTNVTTSSNNETATSNNTATKNNAAASGTSGTSSTSSASSTSSTSSSSSMSIPLCPTNYHATSTLFELDKEQDLILGNFDMFTKRMSNAVNALKMKRNQELQLHNEAKKLGLDSMSILSKNDFSNGSSSKKNRKKRKKKDFSPERGVSWDVHVPDPYDDKVPPSAPSDVAAVDNVSSSPSPPPPSSLKRPIDYKFDDMIRMNYIMSKLVPNDGTTTKGPSSSSSSSSSPKRTLKPPPPPSLIVHEPIVLPLGATFLPNKSISLQAESQAFSKSTSSRGKKGGNHPRISTIDGSPAICVRCFMLYFEMIHLLICLFSLLLSGI
jgi:hypothetical protein